MFEEKSACNLYTSQAALALFATSALLCPKTNEPLKPRSVN